MEKAHQRKICPYPQELSVTPFYAKIKAQLKQDRHPIPENDIWLAACAMAYNLTIVTADKHFSFIKGLSLENR